MEQQAPSKKYTRKRRACSKMRCEGCKETFRVRGLILIKGKFLCHNCRRKTPTSRIQESAVSIGRGYITLDEALNRVYEIKRYNNSNGSITFPSCLAEKFVMLTLVNPEEVQKNEKRN